MKYKAVKSFTVRSFRRAPKMKPLQIISAVLLTPEKVTISNIPDILDVNLLIELLGEMNVKIERPQRDTCIFQANDVNIDYLHSEAL